MASSGGVVAPAPIMYPPHPVHLSIPPHTVPATDGMDGGSGGGSVVEPHFHVHDVSYDSPNANSDGRGPADFSPDGAVLAAPPQMMMLPPPHEQHQQPGRFSPTAPMPNDDGGGGGGVSPMFAHRQSVGYGPALGGGGGGEAAEAFEALLNALCWQVEYYFSADNLVRDAYLRGLMDSEGFVAVSKVRDRSSLCCW